MYKLIWDGSKRSSFAALRRNRSARAADFMGLVFNRVAFEYFQDVPVLVIQDAADGSVDQGSVDTQVLQGAWGDFQQLAHFGTFEPLLIGLFGSGADTEFL